MRILRFPFPQTRDWAVIGLSLLLPGCPVTDNYYIDSHYADSNIGGATGAGGAATGGAAGSLSTGGNSGGGAVAGGGSASLCGGVACVGTCCPTGCVDLHTNPSNCGACGTICVGGKACVAGQCVSGWAAMAAPPVGFIAREKAAYAVFGSKLFIFGGTDINGISLGDGAIYDASSNTWSPITIDANAPTARRLATAVWTGSQIMVYGGRADAAGVGFASAAAYNPANDTWSAVMSNSTGRVGPLGGASSTQAIFWGGWGVNSTLVSGAERYTVATNSWAAATVTAYVNPGAIQDAAWGFSGQNLYLFGGLTNGTSKSNLFWQYSLATNSWTQLTALSGPIARWGAFGVWDGLSLFVWGGRDETSAKTDGAFYHTNTWTATLQTGAPMARWAPHRQSGWAFSLGTPNLVFLGGQDFTGNFLTDGGQYDSGYGTGVPAWTPIPSWPSGEAHQWGVAANLGGTIVVWGGRNGTFLTTTGDRWAQ